MKRSDSPVSAATNNDQVPTTAPDQFVLPQQTAERHLHVIFTHNLPAKTISIYFWPVFAGMLHSHLASEGSMP